ncbi:GTPase HflX, partial [bacterium]|nr:GTPase HflX [bacterium]
MATKKAFSTENIPPRTLVLGIFAPYNKMTSVQDYFDEFESLVDTLGVEPTEKIFIRLRSIDKATFLTKGKLHEVAEACEKLEIERVICSEILRPLQRRALEDHLECEIIDREELILQIFKRSAMTSEGKVQVEMAEVELMKTRLAGRGQGLAQQLGVIGGKGPGETYKEKIRRYLEEKMHQAKKHLKILEHARETQRKRRVRSGVPQFCLVGYTNAGKSSILNVLTKSDVLEEDKLFATLDTTTRELFLEKKGKVLLSDTIGFISQLPHQLINAFHATLDELKYADLLIHVIDISNHAWEDQIATVEKTLEEIGVHDCPILNVFNKSDKLSESQMDFLLTDIER